MAVAATAAARGADTPVMRTALDVLVRLPVENNNYDKFANVGGRGGGGGRLTGDRWRDDHQSAIHPCCNMSGTVLRHGQKWNRLNFKQLGKFRVIIFEKKFEIVVPVDLSCYVFGRRWCRTPSFNCCFTWRNCR